VGNALIDLETCNRELTSLVAVNEGYSYIEVAPPSGIMTCSSCEQGFDATTGHSFANLMGQNPSLSPLFQTGRGMVHHASTPQNPLKLMVRLRDMFQNQSPITPYHS
jgi:hypothetical protein